MGWNYLSFPKNERLHRRSLGMDKQSFPKLQLLHVWSFWMNKWFHPTLYTGYNYLSTLGLNLNHASNCPRSLTGWRAKQQVKQLLITPRLTLLHKIWHHSMVYVFVLPVVTYFFVPCCNLFGTSHCYVLLGPLSWYLSLNNNTAQCLKIRCA